MSTTSDDTSTTVTRARCDGYDGFTERDGTVVPGHRKHLLALERLTNVREGGTNRKGQVWVKATGPCPVCGLGWQLDGYGSHGPAGRGGTYFLVGVKGTFVSTKLCNAACRQLASAECRCSCGGADHGMHA